MTSHEKRNTFGMDFGNMSFEQLIHHDVKDCDFSFEMSKPSEVMKMSSPGFDVSNSLTPAMNGSAVYGTVVKDIPMCKSVSCELDISPVASWSVNASQYCPEVSSQYFLNGSKSIKQEVLFNNQSLYHVNRTTSGSEHCYPPISLLSHQPAVQSQNCFVATDDLSKLVESCNVKSASRILNGSFSDVYGHDWRPAKRMRLSGQEMIKKNDKKSRVDQSFGTNNNQSCGLINQVSRESNRIGMGSEKKDVVSPGYRKSEPTSCLTENSDNIQSLTGLKERNVSLLDSLTAHELQEHIRSLGKVTNEADDHGGSLCQLCDMNMLPLNPVPVYCTPCGSRIKKNLIYYWTSDEMGAKHSFCGHCFRKSRGESISIQGQSFCKSDFRKEKNIEEDEETWVQCDKCECWQHQICGLYNSRNDSEGMVDYICPFCRLQQLKVGEHMPLSAPFGAEDLPGTKLSDHIEERLHRRLEEERLERAMLSGMCVDEVPGAENLVVRVVVSSHKLVKVKQQFLDIFHGKNYPVEFPYKSKMILLFQKIKGVDVCLFAMYVQEYGSDCHPPTQRAVYISYIDSVNHFQPQIRTVHGEALRTFVYHEILIGYLDYCKKLGFETCYIWACPPVKYEDYIFNCHPESQKNPKSDKLRQWYKSMLVKATEDNIVVDTTNFYDRFFVPNAKCSTKVTIANLPYFDGAYWASAAEDLYMRFDKERIGSEETNKMSKRALKSMGHINLSGESQADILVMQKLGQAILPVKEDFIIVHLQFCCSSCHKFILFPNHWLCAKCKSFRVCPRCINMVQGFSKKTHFIDGEKHTLSEIVVSSVPENTDDEDVVLDNDIFENRNSFLSLCQKSHYQFDSLRRAKYSSMMILHHLHNQWPTQSSCITKHGTQDKELQKHKMALKLQEILKTLVHAVQCKHSQENPCSYSKCSKLRNLFHHASQCKVRVPGGCQLCKMAWALLHLHARNCNVADCQVPRCQDIRMSRNLETTQASDDPNITWDC